MSLCEALHGRAAMAIIGAPWPAMGSSSERGKMGTDDGTRGRGLGAAWGGGGL
jgi:hypothetical protein